MDGLMEDIDYGMRLMRQRRDIALVDVTKELERATDLHGPMASPHEGYAVLLEEVDELKTHVFMKQKNRELAEMRKEAIQVAAMALRFVVDVCTEDRGRR